MKKIKNDGFFLKFFNSYYWPIAGGIWFFVFPLLAVGWFGFFGRLFSVCVFYYGTVVIGSLVLAFFPFGEWKAKDVITDSSRVIKTRIFFGFIRAFMLIIGVFGFLSLYPLIEDVLLVFQNKPYTEVMKGKIEGLESKKGFAFLGQTITFIDGSGQKNDCEYFYGTDLSLSVGSEKTFLVLKNSHMIVQVN